MKHKSITDSKVLIQFPENLRKKHASVASSKNEMEAFHILPNGKRAIQHVLQTSHCLEVVLAGSCIVNKSEYSYPLQAQDIHFRKRGNYIIERSEDYSSLLYFFENAFIIHFLKEHVVSFFKKEFYTETPPFLFKVSPFITANVQETIDVIHHNREYNSCIARFSLHQILLQILDRAPDKEYVTYLKHLISNEKVDLHYFMDINYSQNLDLKTLAKQTGRSLSTFKKDFHASFGTSPQKWQINRRLIQANFLLKTTNKSIADVAYESGFENISHFSRVYKEKYGITPSQTKREDNFSANKNNFSTK